MSLFGQCENFGNIADQCINTQVKFSCLSEGFGFSGELRLDDRV